MHLDSATTLWGSGPDLANIVGRNIFLAAEFQFPLLLRSVAACYANVAGGSGIPIFCSDPSSPYSWVRSRTIRVLHVKAYFRIYTLSAPQDTYSIPSQARCGQRITISAFLTTGRVTSLSFQISSYPACPVPLHLFRYERKNDGR